MHAAKRVRPKLRVPAPLYVEFEELVLPTFSSYEKEIHFISFSLLSRGPVPLHRRDLPRHEAGRHRQHLPRLRRRPPAFQPRRYIPSNLEVRFV